MHDFSDIKKLKIVTKRINKLIKDIFECTNLNNKKTLNKNVSFEF